MMEMEFSILDCFMIAAVCGFVFGLAYELLRIVRKLIPFTVVTFVCDIVFFAAAACVILYLSMYLGNYIRIYTILGFGAGVFAYIQTIARLLGYIENAVIGLISFAASSIVSAIVGSFKKIFGAFAHILLPCFGIIYDFLVRVSKKLLSLLQFGHKKRYNIKKDITIAGEISEGKNVIKARIKKSA